MRCKTFTLSIISLIWVEKVPTTSLNALLFSEIFRRQICNKFVLKIPHILTYRYTYTFWLSVQLPSFVLQFVVHDDTQHRHKHAQQFNGHSSGDHQLAPAHLSYLVQDVCLCLFMLDAIPVVDHRIHHYQTPQGKDIMYHRSHLPDCVLSSRTTRLLREMSHLPDRVLSSRTTRHLRERTLCITGVTYQTVSLLHALPDFWGKGCCVSQESLTRPCPFLTHYQTLDGNESLTRLCPFFFVPCLWRQRLLWGTVDVMCCGVLGGRLAAHLDNVRSQFDGWWQRHLTQLQRRIQMLHLTERYDQVFSLVISATTVHCQDASWYRKQHSPGHLLFIWLVFPPQINLPLMLMGH